MANTLKDLAAQAKLVAQDALEKALIELKTYIDTFNEIKAFLAGIQDTTLQQLLNAVSTAIQTEETRATAAESALSGRVTTLENVSIMTESEAKTIFDSVFNPVQP